MYAPVVAEKVISLRARRQAEREGDTAYGTSYPIRNCDELRRAIQAYGRAPKSERAKLRRFIARRRRELDCDQSMPESWYAGEHGGSHVVVRSKRQPAVKPDSQPTYRMKADPPRRRTRGDRTERTT